MVMVVLLLLMVSVQVLGDFGGGAEDLSWWPDETGNNHFAKKGRRGGFKGKWYRHVEEDYLEKPGGGGQEIKPKPRPETPPPEVNMSSLVIMYWKVLIVFCVFLAATFTMLIYKIFVPRPGDESVPVSPAPAPPVMKETMAARLRSPHDSQLVPTDSQRGFELLL